MLDAKTTPKITVEKNSEGDIVVTLPSPVWDGEDGPTPGTIQLFLDEKQMEDLGKEVAGYELATLIEKAELLLSKLPRDSVRRDLGRVGVKVLKRYQSARKSKQAMEDALDHIAEVVAPVLEKVGFGK